MNKQANERIQPAGTCTGGLDQEIMKAFARGRDSGLKSGKVQGTTDMIRLFQQWVQDIDEQVPGIGERTQEKLYLYFSECCQHAIKEAEMRETDKKEFVELSEVM